jgi:hypothetical protein
MASTMHTCVHAFDGPGEMGHHHIMGICSINYDLKAGGSHTVDMAHALAVADTPQRSMMLIRADNDLIVQELFHSVALRRTAFGSYVLTDR